MKRLRPKFLSDVVQISVLSDMDFLAVKIFGLTSGVAYISVQTDSGQNGIVSFHMIDPKNQLKRKRLSTEGFHPIDYFGEAMLALKEAMKQFTATEPVPDRVETSFPGTAKTVDIGGRMVTVGFAGGSPKENGAIADFGIFALRDQLKNMDDEGGSDGRTVAN